MQGRHAITLVFKPKTDGPVYHWSPWAIIQAFNTVIAAGTTHLKVHQKWESQGSCNTQKCHFQWQKPLQQCLVFTSLSMVPSIGRCQLGSYNQINSNSRHAKYGRSQFYHCGGFVKRTGLADKLRQALRLAFPRRSSFAGQLLIWIPLRGRWTCILNYQTITDVH